MQDFYLENIIKITMLRHIYDALVISVFMHFHPICAPSPVFIFSKTCLGLYGRGILFCVRRSGCGCRACGSGSHFIRVFVAMYDAQIQ
uniref:Uncharacterized protein n=1 Tax=Anguilla anguilla TaxID=7936 RepID=A0A0E9WVN4_ANGAN